MSIMDHINASIAGVDHNEVKSGGDFEYTPPEAGGTVGVFIEYIELGKQKQPAYQGKEKPDAEMVRLTFALTHPKKNLKEIEVEGGTKKIQERISFDVVMSLHEKAKFRKIYDKMKYGRDGITHMAQMLGNKFILTISHSESEKNGKTRVYANLWSDAGEIGINAPIMSDPIAGTSQNIEASIPGAIDPMRVFFWNNATKETWDSLFIDGTREVKDDKGGTKQVSKNWLQEKILGATNFKGSSLETLIHGVADIHKEAQKQTGGVEIDNEGGELTSKAETTSNGGNASDDALAALGLS